MQFEIPAHPQIENALWGPDLLEVESVPMIAYYEHGKSARKLLQLSDNQPEGGITAKQQPLTADYQVDAESNTPVSGPSERQKLTREEAMMLDDRIAEALREDKHDHTIRMLSIAPDVARIIQTKSFTELGFRSKDAYFRSRHESKPYMRALEIIGNSDVELIRDFAEEHHLSWKDLQIFAKVESDPVLLPSFVEKHAPARGQLPARKFESLIKKAKHPERADVQAEDPATVGVATSNGDEAKTSDTEQTPASGADLASDFESKLSIFVESLPRDDNGLTKLNELNVLVTAALARAVRELATPPDGQSPAEVVVNAPITVDTGVHHTEYAAG